MASHFFRSQLKAEEFLESGQQALHRLLLRIGMVSLCAVISSSTLAWILRIAFADAGSHFDTVISSLTITGQMLFLAAAPLANGSSLSRAILISNIVIMAAVALSFEDVQCKSCWRHGWQPVPGTYCKARIVLLVWYVAQHVVLALSAFGPTCWSLRRNHILWRCFSLYAVLDIMGDIASIAIYAYYRSQLSYQIWSLLASMIMLSVAWTPLFRESLSRWVRRLFEAQSAKASAAGIGGLISGCAPREVISLASGRFRSVLISDLSLLMLADNSPNPAFFDLSSLVRSGQCDAFVSHSWQDDPASKWAALQDWCVSHSVRTHQEPRLWIDKVCIDQSKIEIDLRCLPVFLSGCRYLVVLCGPSYLTRLWCLLELFTFMHVGGSSKRIHISPLLRQGHEEEDVALISESIKDFDAKRCACSSVLDREKILSVIETACGGVDAFTKAIKEIMKDIDFANLQVTASFSDASSEMNSRHENEST